MSTGNGKDGEILKELIERGPVYKSLHLQATIYVRGMPDMFNSGVSAEDILHDVLIEFLVSPRYCGWDPRKSKVFENTQDLEIALARFLSKILKCRVLDNIRAHGRYVRRCIPIDAERFAEFGNEDSAITADVTGEPEDGSPSVEEQLYFEELKLFFIGYTDGEPIAKKMIDNADKLSRSGRVDQELAEIILGDTNNVDPIINARKRFKRKRPKMEERLCMKPMNAA